MWDYKSVQKEDPRSGTEDTGTRLLESCSEIQSHWTAEKMGKAICNGTCADGGDHSADSYCRKIAEQQNRENG